MTLASRLHALGAIQGLSGGASAPRRFTSLESEVLAIRSSIGLSALTHVACVRVEGDGAYDALDRICPAPLHVRNGMIRHTLLLGADGLPSSISTSATTTTPFSSSPRASLPRSRRPPPRPPRPGGRGHDS